jgi:hypothetical protein
MSRETAGNHGKYGILSKPAEKQNNASVAGQTSKIATIVLAVTLATLMRVRMTPEPRCWLRNSIPMASF